MTKPQGHANGSVAYLHSSRSYNAAARMQAPATAHSAICATDTERTEYRARGDATHAAAATALYIYTREADFCTAVEASHAYFNHTRKRAALSIERLLLLARVRGRYCSCADGLDFGCVYKGVEGGSAYEEFRGVTRRAVVAADAESRADEFSICMDGTGWNSYRGSV